MYRFVGNKCYFYADKEGDEFYDPFIPHFSEFLHRSKKQNTVKKYITAIHRYWIYSLFFPMDSSFSYFDFTFRDWLSEYEVALEKGFRVRMNCYGSQTKSQGDYFVSKPLKNTGQEFAFLESYFRYLYDKDINPLYELSKNEELVLFSGAKDYEALDTKAKYSKGSGYGLKAKGLAKESLAERVTLFSEFKKRNKNSGKKDLQKNEVFPFALFDELLEIADDRSKLLYLLCGAASARNGQALSLTKFDIDMRNRRVYLIDPRTDNVPVAPSGEVFLSQEPRNKLLSKYKIFFNENTKYKYIQFKRPIPVESTTTQYLYFIQDRYKEMFFETYARYRNKIKDDYPMVFQTSSENPHNIWLPSNANDKFKKDIEKLQKKFPQYARRLKLRNKSHSLRHMFGQYIANMAYLNSDKLSRDHTTRLPNLEVKNTIELYKEFCAKKMGITSDAIEVYFNADFATDNYIQMKIQEKHEEAAKIKQTIIELRANDENLYEEAI